MKSFYHYPKSFCFPLIALMALSAQISFGQLFQQDFNSSTVLAPYISATPNNHQFTAITPAVGLSISAASNSLVFTRSAAASGTFSRIADFSPAPLTLKYSFDLSVSTTVSASSVAQFKVGQGFSNANTPELNSTTYGRIGIDFVAVNQFKLRDMSAANSNSNTGNPGPFSGTQTVTWYMNNNVGTISYMSPAATTEYLASDKMDVWVGTTKVFDDIAVTSPLLSMTDLKFVMNGGNGSITLDNILIVPAVCDLLVSASSTPVSCTGSSYGTATANIIQGVPGYAYSWSPGGQTTSTATNLSAGTYSVSVTDNSGCTSTASTTVGVTTDVTNPMISCSGNISNASTDPTYCSAFISVPAPTVSDNCAVDFYYNDYNGSSTLDDYFAEGTTTVVWTVYDVSGNSNTCSQTITVTDNEIPTFDACPANILANTSDDGTGDCGVVVSWTEPNAYDNCILNNVVYGSSPGVHNNGDSYSPGTYTISYTASDMQGNLALCSFTITVVDDEKPTVSCVSSTSKNVNAGSCYYTAAGGEFDATGSADNCGIPALTYRLLGATTGTGASTLDGVNFNKGVTTVRWIATDAAGNKDSCSFTVTVIDNIPPTISCLSDQPVAANNAGCSFVISGGLFDPTSANDNCAYTLSYSINGGPAVTANTVDGVVLSYGTSSITWTIDDGSNAPVSCSFNVTVNNGGLSVAAANDGPKYAGSTLGFSATPSGGTGPYTYSWSGPVAVTNPTDQNPSISNVQINANGVYTVVITDANGCTNSGTTSAIVYGTTLYVNDNSTTGDHYTTAIGNDANPGTSGAPFATIQHAINVAQNGNIIMVDAGSYAEDLIVNKSVTINGSNAGVNACSGMRLAESIIYPGTADIASREIMHVAASNVTIDGFDVNGDNPSLTSGYTSTNGADIDAAEGITVYETNINNLTVTNNIIENLSYFGVTLYDYPAAVPSAGHVISNNKIQNLGTYDATSGIDYWGGGVLLYNNQYAAVMNNCMDNVRLGVQTGNFHQANPGTPASAMISGNTMTNVRRSGVFHNLHYSNASAYTISNNSITGSSDPNETRWDGISLFSLSVPATAMNNNINASAVTQTSKAYEVWNVKSISPASISGGSANGASIGVALNNYDGYQSDAPDGAYASISNLAITPSASGKGIYLLDNSLSTHAAVSAAIGSGVTITGGSDGLEVENASSIVSSLGNAAFSGQSNNYIQLINNAININATTATFAGNTGATATLAQNFAIEDKIVHKVDNGALGFVLVKSANDFVTVNSYASPYTTGSVQRGVDAASNGFTVNVDAGTYNENVVVNKGVTLSGANYGVSCTGARGAESIINSTGASGSITVNVTSANVTINGFTISNPAGSFGIYNKGNSSNDIQDNIITNIGNATSGSQASYGVAIEMGSAANMSNVNVSNNCVNYIRGGANTSLTGTPAKNNNGSGVAIGAGFSTAAFDISNLTINSNTIDHITASTAAFTDGGKGAYGVLINVGASISAAGKAVSPQVSSNDITLLEGLWAHAVGLEGETPGADVSNNYINSITDHKGNTDAVGVQVEDNAGAATVGIHNNSFTAVALGVNNVTGTLVNATCNWYGTTTPSGVAAMNSSNVNYTPWLISGTDANPSTGFTPATACSACGLVLSTSNTDANNCPALNNGTATVNVVSGGISPFAYAWSNGQTTQTATGLVAGTYTVTVTDINGCTASASVTVVSNTNSGPVHNINTGFSYCTIQNAIDAAATTNGHTITIDPGTYNEQVIVNKSLTLQAASATQPTIDFTGTVSGKPTLVDISADNVTINNIHFNVDMSKLRSAIIASSAGLDNIAVTNNIVDAYGTPAGSFGDRNAVSVNYGGPTNYRVATGGVNSITFTGNTINGSLPTSFFRAGMATDESGGSFNGNTLQTISHDVIVRFGSNGNITINNNNINGGGVELDDMNAGAGTLTVSGNTFDGTFANIASPGSAVLRLQNNYNSKTTNVTGNTFSNHQWGVLLANYNSVTLDNNTFTPLAGSTVFHHVVIDNKSISSNSNSIPQLAIGATLTNNTFNGSGSFGGTALAFLNHNTAAPSYGTFTIGSAGNENIFNDQIAKVIYLDHQSGSSSSSTFPAYTSLIGSGAGAITTMGLWTVNLDASNNKFDVGSGLQLPTAMSLADLYTLEDRIQHKVDLTGLGFVTIKSNNDYVTTNSFVSPLTTTGSVQRGVDAASNGFTVNVAAGTYNENVVVNKGVTLSGANYGVSCTGARGAESIINSTGASGSITVNVTSANVTINGFTISNPAGSFGIYNKGNSSNDIQDNIITNIGNATSGSQASYGVAIEMGSAANMSNVNVSNNCVNYIRGGANTSLTGTPAKNNNGSGVAIGAGFSTAAFDISNLTINSNTIDHITASTAAFTDGGKGAYGVLINVGASISAAGKAVSPQVSSNDITLLEGLWAHAVGLEGETPGADVSNNYINSITDHKGNTDAVGVQVEDNAGAATVGIHNNSFTAVALGVNNVTGTLVNATCNWYGTTTPSGVAAMNSSNVNYTPWLISGTDANPSTGFTPATACSACGLVLSTSNTDANNCPALNNGTATVNVVSGGISPFAYAWSNGQTTQTATGLVAGTYTVTVTDINGCTASASVTVVSNTNSGPVHNINTGFSYCTIQNAIDAAATTDGHTITVDPGTYDEDVNINKTLSVIGAGNATTTIRGVFGGDGATVRINANNVEVAGFTITRLGNNPTDWNNPALNTAGIAIQGVAISGTLIRDNNFIGNRTGIDINNSSSHTIRNNTINDNRTGLIFRNQTNNLTVVENEIKNNWTVGVLFLDGSGGSNSPLQQALNSSFNSNDISGNWYGQIVDRQSGGALPTPGTNQKNFTCNWLGSLSPVVTTANSSEPGYATQIPVAYGGSATAPGGQPDIAGPASANIVYTPFLTSGTDANVETTLGRGTFGFQPSTSCSAPCALVITPSSTDVTCNGANDGTASVSVTSGGVGPYTYSWSNGSTMSSITGLAPGTYSVTVRDINGCTAVTSVTITEPNALNATVASTNVTCNGAGDGTITVSSPTGGYGTYEYRLDAGSWQMSGSFASLTPGTYSVQIRDAAHTNCVATLSTITITEPNALNASVSSTNIACNGGSDGSISVTSPSGGYGTYEYRLDVGAWQASGNFTSLAAGSYSVQIRDAAHTSCVVVISSTTVTEPNILSASITSTNTTCNGETDGTITITSPSGGYGTYEYRLDAGSWQASGSFSSLAPGTYSVQIRDAAHTSCVIVLGSVTITQPNALSASVASTNVTCNGAGDGTITVSSPTGGYGTYEYRLGAGSWQASGSFSSIAPGTYSVQIRDAAHTSCVVVLGSVTITEPNVLSASVASANVSCNGAGDGMITVSSPTGGYGTYEYRLNTGSWQVSGSFSPLAPGSYAVQIRDAAFTNCVVTITTVTITEPNALGGTFITTNVTCNSSNNGTITVNTSSGGYGTYEYRLDAGAWQAGNSFTGLAPATYSVQIRDAAHTACTATLGSATITQPNALGVIINITNVTCFGAANGSAMANVTGGTTPYSYSWSNGQTTQTASNLAPGTYSVSISDANGCSLPVQTVTISQPAIMNITTSKTSVSCFGGSNASANAAGSGGTAPYTYSWNTVPVKTTASITGLSAGTYTVTVTDSKGCTKTASVTITQPTQLVSSINIPGSGGAGTATAMGSGGTPGYTFLWNTLSNNQTIPISHGNTYTVTVTDAKGCKSTSSTFYAKFTDPGQPSATPFTARVYPNPTHGNLSIEFDAVENQQYNVSLLDYTGRVVHSQRGSTIEGVNKVEDNFGDFAKGIYFIRIDIEDQTRLMRVIFE